jgi:multiple sugar transport system substrate-binding protein
MLTKKVQLILSMLLSFALLFIGCSSQNTSNQQPSGTSGSGKDGATASSPKVLKMWTRDSSEKLLKEAIEKYNKTNDKNIKIELTTIPANNFSDQYSTALASNSAPDIVSIDLVLAPYFTSIGAFKDVTDKYNALEFKDQFNENMVHLGQRDGKQFAVPFSADVSALIYNKQHFKDVGLDPEKPPVTWEELRDYAKKLTTKDRYGYVYGGGNAGTLMFTFMPYVWGNGGEFLNKDGTKALVDSPEAVEALQFFADLTQKDKVTPEGVTTYTSQQVYDAFTSGKASMMVNGNFRVNDLNTKFKDIDYGVALIPKKDGKKHSSFAGGELVAISSTTKSVDEAWDFIKFALSKDIQVETWAKSGTIPVRKDFHKNQYFDAEPKYKVFGEALTVANTPYTTKYNELYNPILSSIQSALQGKQSPKDAFAKAAADMNKILEKK